MKLEAENRNFTRVKFKNSEKNQEDHAEKNTLLASTSERIKAVQSAFISRNLLFYLCGKKFKFFNFFSSKQDGFGVHSAGKFSAY